MDISKNKKRTAGFKAVYSTIVEQIITDVTVVYNGGKTPSKALWDTGATKSFICSSIVAKHEMFPEKESRVSSLNNPGATAKVYSVDVVLPNNVQIKNLLVREADFGSEGFKVIIGMDVINRGNIQIDNSSGRTEFTFIMNEE